MLIMDDNDDISPMVILTRGLKSKGAQRQYERMLQRFFDFLGLAGTLDEQAQGFIKLAKQNPDWVTKAIIRFLPTDKLENGTMSQSTIANYLKPIKLLCEVYEVSEMHSKWKKISRFVPSTSASADDRCPSLEELQSLIKYNNPRVRPFVLVMSSCGMSVEAWEYLRWGHIQPHERDGKIVAAKMYVNVGKRSTRKRRQYYTYITPEAYFAVKEWMDYRASCGEKIEKESLIMRDAWQTTNIPHGKGAKGLATCPKKISYSGLLKIIDRAYWTQGLRQPLSDGKKRHPWKLTHGFRKWFKTRTELAGMKTLFVEKLMGHDTGLAESYFKPDELLDDYLKAVTSLTIESLSVQVAVAEQTRVLSAQMESKDKDMHELKERMDKMGDVIIRLDSAVKFYKHMFLSYARQFGGRPLTDKERERLEEFQEQLRNAPDSDDYDDD
jgi:hypothetical protein